MFSLAYRQDGETRIDVATFDADEIQAFFDAMSSIKVKNVTTERSSDCDDIFYSHLLMQAHTEFPLMVII